MYFSWFLLVGLVLILMAFASRWVSRMPLSFAVIYLVTGVLIGPHGLGLLAVDLLQHANYVEVLAEVAILISLFAVGLRLHLPFTWAAWRTPIKLATITMMLTIAGITVAAHTLLQLPWPVALLLGAILAPTDPVLASDVQVQHAGDRDALRVSLTAEAGLNDGAAFPAVLLGLALISDQPQLATWFTRDVLWAVGAGIGLGALCGMVLALAVDRLRRSGVPLDFEEFLAFGLIAISYGTALAIHAYGFVAVFVAGLSFAHAERSAAGANGSTARAGAEAAGRLLAFSIRCERLAEVALVLLIGAALWTVTWSRELILFAGALILVVRPVATALTIRRAELSTARRRMLAWFGIRGIGSLYYAAFAIGQVTGAPWTQQVAGATLATVAISVGVHGISATPLMRWLRRTRRQTVQDQGTEHRRR